MAQIEIEQSWLSACRLSNRLDISLNKSEFFIHCRQAAVILGEKEKERDSEKETKGYCKSFFLTVESCFVQRREDNDRPERSNADLESIAMTIDIACARSLSLFLSIESDVKDFFPNDLQEIITRIPCQEIFHSLGERASSCICVAYSPFPRTSPIDTRSRISIFLQLPVASVSVTDNER